MILSFQEQEKLLRKHKIKRPKTFFVSSLKELSENVKKVGFPLVLKISSRKHLHRTEVKGVFTNISSLKEAEETYRRLIKIKNIDGVLLQQQIDGYEFVIGLKEDEVFGKTIMFGSGGTMIEILKDVSFRLLPVDKKEIEKMIKEVKSSTLLGGFRKKEKIDLKEVINSISQVGQMSIAEDIKEADFNPVIINNQGVFFCDVKITKHD